MSKQTATIVGRPNVGKSTLFNKLIGERRSIVDDTPGVTRDRVLGECEWGAYRFDLIDTGGLDEGKDEIISRIREQAETAIALSDVIIMVCDLRSGPTAADEEIAAMLRKSGRPIVLCVNKCDSTGAAPPELYDFYSLGLGEPLPVSSVHGHGTGDLLDEICSHLKPDSDEEPEAEDIKVAVIGRPNSGKSSLVNRLLGDERMIVSDVAGTTRDAIDSYFENEQGRFTLIDTAGMRKKGRISESVERYSVLRALAAVGRADVCVIMVDATEGFAEQDSKVAGYAHEEGKGCVIAVNKWDLVEKDGKTMEKLRKRYEQDFSFMSYAPIVFISAKEGQRLDKLLELVKLADASNRQRITTGQLNELLARATARVQPPSDKGKRLKIYYMTQASVRPPTFVVFVNRAELFHFSYQRYIENRLREAFGFEGTPVRFVTRERGD
ncbi:MAG: ribosome biogenesis GTPase Der [Oscillospiraceae bacterium]|nr:ribosome biogenesis GTPase Der [Oscillospiraceae bacterium]